MKNAPLNKAITYAVGQKDALSVFLQDGRIPISNNPVENAIRLFAVGRKNWILCNVPRGATASATAYSIIETAKLNELGAYKVLRFLLRRLPTETAPFTDDVLEKLALWSQAAQVECK